MGRLEDPRRDAGLGRPAGFFHGAAGSWQAYCRTPRFRAKGSQCSDLPAFLPDCFRGRL